MIKGEERQEGFRVYDGGQSVCFAVGLECCYWRAWGLSVFRFVGSLVTSGFRA